MYRFALEQMERASGRVAERAAGKAGVSRQAAAGGRS